MEVSIVGYFPLLALTYNNLEQIYFTIWNKYIFQFETNTSIVGHSKYFPLLAVTYNNKSSLPLLWMIGMTKYVVNSTFSFLFLIFLVLKFGWSYIYYCTIKTTLLVSYCERSVATKKTLLRACVEKVQRRTPYWTLAANLMHL